MLSEFSERMNGRFDTIYPPLSSSALAQPPAVRRGAILRRRKYAGYYCKSNFCISAKACPTRGTASRLAGIYNASIKRSGNRVNLSLTSGAIFRGKYLNVEYLNI